MNLFVTGGTGVLGRPAVRGLAGAGHRVRVAVRSAAKADLVRALGGEPVVVDLFDAGAVKGAVADAGAEIVLHLATAIPPASAMHKASAWRDNDRLRGEATPILAEAARAAGAHTLVAESVTFMYPDRGDEWIDEDVPWPPPHPRWASTYALEDTVRAFAVSGGRGIALRFGAFYGPESRSTDEAMELARLRLGPVVGPAAGYVSSIHTDDAAAAVVAAVAAPAGQLPSGAYNVVDDEPVTRRAYLDAFASAFGTPKLRPLPGLAVRAVNRAAEILTRSQRISNRRFRDATGWTPRHASVHGGWPAVAAARAAAQA